MKNLNKILGKFKVEKIIKSQNFQKIIY
jgi:hypothetical protein